MGERKKLYDEDAKTKEVRKPSKTCLCGRSPFDPCRRYAAYTDGYCRKCSHSRTCCKGKKRGRR